MIMWIERETTEDDVGSATASNHTTTRFSRTHTHNFIYHASYMHDDAPYTAQLQKVTNYIHWCGSYSTSQLKNMVESGCLKEFVLEWRTIIACGVVMLNPLFWNLVSRLEYRTHLVSRVAGGPRRGVGLLALGIVSFNYLRTTLFHKVVENHATCMPMQNTLFDSLGYLLIVVGAILVISSSYRLGFFCSFMGDYFGILLDEKVTNFPFNVVNDPMYVGSTLVYLGIAFHHASIVGLILTGCIALSYAIALSFEQPFTAEIYRNKLDKSS